MTGPQFSFCFFLYGVWLKKASFYKIGKKKKKINRVNICILFGQVADKEKGAVTLSALSTAGVHLSEPLFLHLTSRKNTHPTYV